MLIAFQEISNSKKRAFLVAYARTGRITAASRLSRMHWRNHYNWLERDPDYSQAFAEAKKMAADFAEDDVLKRAFEGDYKPIIYQGKIRGRYKEKSDVLAMFALKALKPDYRDGNQINIATQGPSSITFVSGQPRPELLCTQPQGTNSVKQIPPETLPILPPAGEK